MFVILLMQFAVICILLPMIVLSIVWYFANVRTAVALAWYVVFTLGLTALFSGNVICFVATIICGFTIRRMKEPSLWKVIPHLTIAIIAGTLVAGLSYLPKLEKERALQAQYAFQSLSPRLKGTTFHNRTSNRKDDDSQSSVARRKPGDGEYLHKPWPGIETSVEERSYLRMRELKSLHEQELDRFVKASGFGVYRTTGIQISRIELLEIPPIPQPNFKYDSATPETGPPEDGKPIDPNKFVQNVKNESLLETHWQSYLDFANPQGFGYFKNKDSVSGFEAHRFSALPKIEKHEEWLTSRVELVGLLKHGKPVVYVSEHLPRMDELKDAATRPLDVFEAHALVNLRRGEDIVERSSQNEIRMLGAIRNVESCIQCHDGARGDLLGAFSYRFVRSSALPGNSAEPNRPKT